VVVVVAAATLQHTFCFDSFFILKTVLIMQACGMECNTDLTLY